MKLSDVFARYAVNMRNGWFLPRPRRTGNILENGNAIYSYGTHFPLAWHGNYGLWVNEGIHGYSDLDGITRRYGSRSTANHATKLQRALHDAGYRRNRSDERLVPCRDHSGYVNGHTETCRFVRWEYRPSTDPA